MKRSLIALTFAVALTGCSTIDKINSAFAVPTKIETAIQTPIPGQAKTVFGSELTYDFCVKLAQHYVDSGQATPAQKKAIHDFVEESYPVVKAASNSAQNGSNTGITTALATINQVNTKWAGILVSFGIQIPK